MVQQMEDGPILRLLVVDWMAVHIVRTSQDVVESIAVDDMCNLGYHKAYQSRVPSTADFSQLCS